MASIPHPHYIYRTRVRGVRPGQMASRQDMNKVLEKIFREVDALPEDRQQRIMRLIEVEVEKAKREADASDGRWARLAERLRHEAPMAGKSEKFLESVRQFREHFDTSGKRSEK